MSRTHTCPVLCVKIPVTGEHRGSESIWRLPNLVLASALRFERQRKRGEQLMRRSKFRRWSTVILVSGALLLTTACGTLTGAAVGAGSGAAIGAGTGYGVKKGALVGTGIGAAAGAIYDITR